jgi:predicted nuclease of predicted toxin-antitoxin system
MRICANENIGAETVEKLRGEGHDVLWVREAAPGIADSAVLALAQAEHRILLTFDKDFGEFVYRLGAAASPGIVLLRISQPCGATIAERVCAILASRSDWEGHYSVADDFTVRMRALPGHS